MAFIGLLLANIVLLILFIICAGILLVMLVLLMLGIVFAVKKKKKLAIIFFSIDGGILLTIASIIIVGYCYYISPKDIKFETPDGTEEVSSKIITELEESIDNGDVDSVDNILDEYPELIYYYDSTYTDILHKTTMSGDFEIAQCILDHGAEYDDEFMFDRLIYDYSLEYYFGTCSSELSYETVEFMLENGATVTYEGKESTPNALFQTVWWVCSDSEISDEDIALFELLVDYGASVTETDNNNQTAIDKYYDATSANGIIQSDEDFLEGLEVLESATAQ